MKFKTDIKEKEYKKYYNESKYSTILQSYEWGQFCIEGKGQTPYYVGLVDDKDKLICASLLLKRKLPLGKCSFYAPRGFNLDFNNQELLEIFTKELIKFLKEEKAISLTIDPEVMYQEIDNEVNVIPNGKNNYQIHNNLLKLGYKHKGFNKLYENNQPRYTFIIDLDDNYENRISKSFLKDVKRSNKFELEFYVGNEDDIKYFNELYKKTAQRDNFSGYGDNYYKRFYEIFHKSNMAQIFLCKLYPQKVIDVLEKELSEINEEIKRNNDQSLLTRQEKVFKDLEFFSKYKNEKNGIVVSAHIMAFYQNYAVALYAGSDRDFQMTYANYYNYYEKFKWVKEHGYQSIDLFGVTGDPNTKYKNLAGLYDFKKKLGGQLVEFIGEYDLIINKAYYYLLHILSPIYYKIRKIIKK